VFIRGEICSFVQSHQRPVLDGTPIPCFPVGVFGFKDEAGINDEVERGLISHKQNLAGQGLPDLLCVPQPALSEVEWVSFVLLTIRFKPIREEFLIVAFSSPHPPKLLCVLCVEGFDFDFLSLLRAFGGEMFIFGCGCAALWLSS